MANKGREYEDFVYEKFKRLFVDSVVTARDKILGNESGLEREIDVSIRLTVGADPMLYIVQCKDHNRPADIVKLGEFSSVIKDVGAAKGFFVCTAGFAKSNYKYAQALGIELLTVEDINSERWKVDIQVPFIYIRKLTTYELVAEIIGSDALAERNHGQELVIKLGMPTLTTQDNGLTTTSIRSLIDARLAKLDSDASGGIELDLLSPGLQIEVADTWNNCRELAVKLAIDRTYYLKYLTPDEYSQIRDHPRDAILPLHVLFKGVSPQLDDSFVEVSPEELPVLPMMSFLAEEWTDLEQAGRAQSA